MRNGCNTFIYRYIVNTKYFNHTCLTEFDLDPLLYNTCPAISTLIHPDTDSQKIKRKRESTCKESASALFLERDATEYRSVHGFNCHNRVTGATVAAIKGFVSHQANDLSVISIKCLVTSIEKELG